jgi:hypothetical protein
MKIFILAILNLAAIFALFSNSLVIIGLSLFVATILFSLYGFLYSNSFQPLFFVIDVFVILIGIILYKSCEISDVISHFTKRAAIKTFPMAVLISAVWGMFALGPKNLKIVEWQTPIISEYALISLVGLIILFMVKKVEHD